VPELPPVEDPDHYFMEWLPAQLAPHDALSARLGTAGEIAQIELSGARGGVWHFSLADGRVAFVRGPHASPSFVILMSVDTWRDLTLEKISAAGAWVRRKIKTRGSLRAMMRVGRLFNA
jgi:hypothetical protein